MQGYSGTYAVNNVDFVLPPTSGKWVNRTQYGVDGQGHPIYSAVRSFELAWDLMSPTDVQQIIGFYNQVVTGTVVACLPQWNAPGFLFYNYSGTTLTEPEVSEYFQGYTTTVKMTVLTIRT